MATPVGLNAQTEFFAFFSMKAAELKCQNLIVKKVCQLEHFKTFRKAIGPELGLQTKNKENYSIDTHCRRVGKLHIFLRSFGNKLLNKCHGCFSKSSCIELLTVCIIIGKITKHKIIDLLFPAEANHGAAVDINWPPHHLRQDAAARTLHYRELSAAHCEPDKFGGDA